MEKQQIMRQFGQMFWAGMISTVIAILTARFFGYWWAGLIGIPIALLTCDLRASKAAIVGVFRIDSKKAALKNRMSRALARSQYGICATLEIIRFLGTVLVCLMSIDLVIISTCTNELFRGFEAVLFIAGMVSLLISSTIVIQNKSNIYFHLVKMTRRISLLADFDAGLLKIIDEVDTNNHNKDGYLFRHKDGSLIKAKDLFQCLMRCAAECIIVVLLMACSLFLVAIIVDTILSILLKITVSKSISCALGVLTGFSSDYLFRPTGQPMWQAVAWLIGCSVLGGLLGCLFWQLKLKIAEWSGVSLNPKAVAT